MKGDPKKQLDKRGRENKASLKATLLLQDPPGRSPPLAPSCIPIWPGPICCIPGAAQQQGSPHGHWPWHYLQHTVGLPKHSLLVRSKVDHTVGAGEEETEAHFHPLTHSALLAAAHQLASAHSVVSCRIWRCQFDHEEGNFYIASLYCKLCLGIFPFLTCS